MRNLTLILLLMISGLGLAQTTPTYNLVFSEDFNGDTLDASAWNIQTGYAYNQEKQYYTNGSIRVKDGLLVITAKKENAVVDRNYTSGRIHTQGKKVVKYGKIEASISVPAGAGTWPAFWMMPDKSVYGGWPKSGEIDIMEHIGSNPRMTSHAVHTYYKNGSTGNNWYNQQYKDSMENKFHLYSLEWGVDYMKFYIDDVKSVTYYRNMAEDYRGWPFDQNFYVILNLAIGGTMGGTVNDAIFNNPVQLKVDYVRMYQLVTDNELIENSDFKVYPSIFQNSLEISAANGQTIRVFNSIGQIIASFTADGKTTLQTSGWLPGIYLVSDGNQTKKIIKN